LATAATAEGLANRAFGGGKEKRYMTLDHAADRLVVLMRAIDDRTEDAEMDRHALLMAVDAVERWAKVRRWVREFRREYTTAEMAEMADLVERVQPVKKEDSHG
jgi:cell division protein ZapA (FtsZ GTPase activity inhibitor)